MVRIIQIIILWLDDQALDVLLLSNVVLLLAFGLYHDFGSALSVPRDCLGLGCALLSVDHGTDLLVLGVGCVSVEAFGIDVSLLLAKLFHHITGIGRGSGGHLLSVVISAGYRVRLFDQLWDQIISASDRVGLFWAFWLSLLLGWSGKRIDLLSIQKICIVILVENPLRVHFGERSLLHFICHQTEPRGQRWNRGLHRKWIILRG